MVVRIVLGVLLLLAGCAEDSEPAAGTSNGNAQGTSANGGTNRRDAAVARDAAGPSRAKDAKADEPADTDQSADTDEPADTGSDPSKPSDGGAKPAKPAATPPVLDDTLRITWTRCDTSYECATLKVPVDYDDASHGSLDIALKRAAATGKRIGSLLINPGGPGGSGIDFLSGLLPGIKNLRARFDIVAFDPRSVGQSTPLDCHSTLQKLVSADPSPDSDAKWMTVDKLSQSFADECEKKYPKLLPYLGTQNVARDMDRIRAGLGEAKLSFLGFSYGTSIGAWYAQLFPQRVRALVLDGAVTQELSAMDMALEQAKGFELALANYFAWCRESASRCTWAQNKPPESAFASLQASIEAKPLPASGYDRPAGPGEFMLAAIMPLYGGEQGWQLLSNALLGAVRGDGGTLIQLTDAYLERGKDGKYPNITEVNNAVNCVDHASPDVAEVRANAQRFQSGAPIFGLGSLSALLVCSHWGAMGIDTPPPTGQGAPPIVVVGTINDPATPYAWAESLAKELASGVLLTWEGEGHTAYTRGSACIDAAVEAYFIDGKVPAAGLRCPATASLVASPLLAPAAEPSPLSLPLVRTRVRGR